MRERNGRPTPVVILGIVIVGLILMTVVFSVSSLLTSFVFERMEYPPSPFVQYLVAAITGVFLIMLTITVASRFSRENEWQGLYQPLIDAIERMAKGDFNVRVEPVVDDHGIFTALTETVNKAAVDLHQMEQLRQEFISNVSHEIQSPLTSIRGFAQALRDDTLSADDRAQYLGIIEAESTRLSRITENLLKLASLDAEKVKFEPQPYPLDRQIRSLILACEPQWSGKQIDLDLALEPLEANADSDLMSQVWINLLHNGIKFTPQGGHIRVELRRYEGYVEFIIADTGMGISDADQGRIFERFYKADASRTQSAGGSGLGLSIVKRIIDLHGGAIRVESTVGIGSRFTVTLPDIPRLI